MGEIRKAAENGRVLENFFSLYFQNIKLEGVALPLSRFVYFHAFQQLTAESRFCGA
jgi:hypothetical protein